MEGAYIYDTVRSPRGRGKNGSLNELTAVALSAKILQELRERNNLNTQVIEDVIWGNVGKIMGSLWCDLGSCWDDFC